MQEKSIPDVIQEILDKNKGFAAISQLPKMMGAQVRQKLGIKSNEAAKILVKKLEPVLEDRFIFRKKGKTVYVLTPCDPFELVMAELSPAKPMTPKMLAKNLPFTQSDIRTILNELSEAGRIKILLTEKLEPQIFSSGTKPYEAKTDSGSQREYSIEEFRKVFNELSTANDFVRICDLRRTLGWPRDTFDQTLRALRDKRIIQMHTGDESYMTPDEVNDSFVNENNYLMGTVTWNVR